MRTLGIVVGAVGALMAGCGWQATPCGAGGADDARMRLLAADAAFSRTAFERGPAAAFGEVLDADSVFLASNYGTLYGVDDVVTFLGGDEALRMSWIPADAEVARGCDIGYTFGAWSAGGADADGNPLDLSGKYLAVWRYQDEGGWRLAVYMQNSDPAGSDVEP